ncbi:sigma 54-interacting transcriptional regulator [Bacillaceae bacterium]
MLMSAIETLHTDFVIVKKPILVKDAMALLRSRRARLLVLEEAGTVAGVCDCFSLLEQSGKPDESVRFCDDFSIITQDRHWLELAHTAAYVLVRNGEGTVIGWLDRATAENLWLKQNYSRDLQELATDLEAIVDSIYDEILVVDAQGKILRVSRRGENNLWGVDPSTMVGENILELEEKGWFKPTVTRRVIQEQRKISVIQENRFGRKILAVGNPIFNKKKRLERIVIASRDITEITRLRSELQQMKKLNEKYRQEIAVLRQQQPKKEKDIIYRSECMEELMEQVKRIARVDSTVTIYGESGVGKELIASAIHHYSERANKPLIKINCGAIPNNLLESELFGYEKGAFTGAFTQGKKGFFELAHEGTLFLDEIAELPLNLQVKLLRAIQEREIVRVGGTKTIPVNVRIIAATNKNLEELVQSGRFREDLYYRLHVIPLYVPALRERTEDIEPLVYHFLHSFNEKFATQKHFSEDAIEMMKAYHWPGNVRQLQNVIERAIVVSKSDLITANELSQLLSDRHAGKKTVAEKPVQVFSIIPLKKAIEMTETQLIELALAKHKTLTKVAEVLEVSQATISRRFQKHFKAKK